jgi:2-polyprenyl-3-methyl-5-hydroxy-6-metoxy-1,4-benzoquinol methylase
MSSGLSRTDVEYAYRLILGREPENSRVVEDILSSVSDIKQLRTHFLSSQEFMQKAANIQIRKSIKTLGWAKIEVEIDVNQDELRQMVSHVESTWAGLGGEEPFWSVLTNDKFKAASIEENKESFYRSGEGSAELFVGTAQRCGIDIFQFKDCFELGCGVGRVTVWLSRIFSTVLASDISAPHLAIAHDAASKYGVQNVEWMHMNSFDALDEIPVYDAFFSLIVLQHNPPPVMVYILKRVLSKLRQGGVAYFQVPTYSLGYRFQKAEYLSKIARSEKTVMEMHVLPQSLLFKLAEESGCELLEIREDSWCGSNNILSNSVLLRKK